MPTQLALRFDEAPISCPTQQRYHAIAHCLAGRNSPADIAHQLNITYATVTRWLREFRAKGLPGLFPATQYPREPYTPEKIIVTLVAYKCFASKASARELAQVIQRATGHKLHHETAGELLERYFFWKYPEFRELLTYPVPSDPQARRLEMVKLHAQGWSEKRIADLLHFSRTTVYKWLRRWQQEKAAGLDESARLFDHSSEIPMLDEQQFRDWCRRLGFSSKVENLIQQIRSSEPARHVRSGHGNVSGRYPSRKMGVTIQFESHRNELAAIYEMEHSISVLEYWDQAPPIKLEYKTPAGRAIGVLHTPYFFVLRADSAGWEEWKMEEDLRRLAETQPNRYRQADDGAWRCPPGEEFAREFGLYYRLRSSAEINWVFQRNIIFLEDYLRADSAPIDPALEEAVRRLVAAQPGITLRELLRQYEVSTDVIYLLIATERVYVDLDAVPLAEPARAPIFPDPQTALAYSHVCETAARPSTHSISLACGAAVSWDGKAWTIVNVGEKNIGLIGESSAFAELPVDVFETLVREVKIIGLESEPSESQNKVKELLGRAGPTDLKEANRRYEVIRPFLKEERSAPLTRTIYRWLAAYRRSESLYGNGYVGLLPRTSDRGNHSLKLPEATRELMNQFIAGDYETNKQKNKQSVYAALLRECEERGVIEPPRDSRRLQFLRGWSHENNNEIFTGVP